MKLVLIPPGEFDMGSTKEEIEKLLQEATALKLPEWYTLRLGMEFPRHRVRIRKPFCLGKYEVTVGQFAKFIEATGYKTDAEKDGRKGWGFNATTGSFVGKAQCSWRRPGFAQSDDRPVVLVSWNDTMEFCRWLSQKEGKTYRLPTEAEWEFGCRAGTVCAWNTGATKGTLSASANIADKSLQREFPNAKWTERWDDGFAFTAPVGTFQSNAFGLCDMHGNVWEHCHDFYLKGRPYEQTPFEDPKGPAAGLMRVKRGGGWCFPAPVSRSAGFRGCSERPDICCDYDGFRVALVLADE